jgi:dienelactone hydrolase
MRFQSVLHTCFGVAALAMTATPARAAPPDLAIYGNLPTFETASISPSGDHIAAVATLGGQHLVVVLDGDRKPVQRVPLDPKAKVRRLLWAGDKDLLIEVTATIGIGLDYTANRAELATVIVLPLDGAKPWNVFGGVEEISGGVAGIYGLALKNGHWFGYFGGRTMKSGGLGFGNYAPDAFNPDLYEVDFDKHLQRKVAGKSEGLHDWRDWLLDDKGEIGAVLDVVASTGQWTITNARGAKLASGIEPSGNVDLVGFTADGSGVIYQVRDEATGSDPAFSVALSGGAPAPFLPDLAIEHWFRDDAHRVIGYRERTADHVSHFFDPRRDMIWKASQRAFPNARVLLRETNRAFDRLLLVTEGPGDPETHWLVNIGTGHADPLGYSYALDPEQVGPMKMVPFVAADGLKMEGVLTLPPDLGPPDRPARNLPAVIMPHGGPTSYDTIRFDWLAQAFASRGYAVFQPNFRGSAGYGVAFELAGNGEWGRKMQTDISDGLGELVRQGVVDPKRVCIVGASYGGYAALAGVTLQHGIYRCAVAVAGISDLSRMINDEVQIRREDPMLMRNLKREIGKVQDLQAVSPVHFADKVDAPVLLIHGKDDTVVKFAQSTEMADALRRAGKPVDLVTLNAEDHWLSRSETRLQMLQASLDFVIRNNPPDAALAKLP